jgi:MFS family permease
LSLEAKFLIYSSVLPAVAYGMFYSDISYFLTQVQGLSPYFMGYILATMGVSAVAASIPLGIAADKYGRKKFLIAGNVIASLIIVVFALTTNLTVLFAAAVFEGISEAAFSASSGALLAEKVEPMQRNGAFSLYGFAQSTAYGVGGIAIYSVVSFQVLGFSIKNAHVLLFVALAALSLLSTFIMLKIKESNRPDKTERGKTSLFPQKSANVLAKYVVTSAILAFGAGMVVPLMTYWMKLRYGIPDVISGSILGLASIAIGVSTLASPFLAQKIGLIRAIVLTQGISTIFMIAIPLCPDYVSASAVYTSRAFLMNMASPLSQSMIMGLIAEDERGAASGVSAALWRLPNALGSPIGTLLMGMGMLAQPFYLAAFLYIISITMFWVYFRNVKMPEESLSIRESAN